jgi:cell wall-associated NlpC family hydrolase
LTGAFRFKDSVYGWGSAYGSVDCSAFVDAVYRAVGIVLPRNTSQIRKAPLTAVSLAGRNRQERLAVLKNLRPGALLHLPGHVMLYVGMDHGVPYAIHALSSYYEDGRKVYVRRVVVTDLLLHRKSGKTFLDELTLCQEVK